MHFIYTSSLNITVRFSSTRAQDLFTFRYAILNGSIDSGKKSYTSFNGVFFFIWNYMYTWLIYLTSIQRDIPGYS